MLKFWLNVYLDYIINFQFVSDEEKIWIKL